MTFTQIPQQYAPLGGELRYAVSAGEAGVIDLRMIDAKSGELIGAKRFAGAATASFDAGPYLRRATRFTPQTGGTGFHTAQGRTVLALVEAVATLPDATGSVTIASPERTFLPCPKSVEGPALLTSMPNVRLISPGESDELTLFSKEACTVTVTAQAGRTATAETYRTKTGGVHLFRLDTADFPGAETLTVDAGACGQVAYTVIPALHGARRIAWRSNAGSVEHYTFPVEQSESVETVKTRAYGAAGRCIVRSAADRLTKLASAYETRAVIAALSEILTSGGVWIAEGMRYTQVDVLTGSAVVHRHGAVSCLEIEIRSITKPDMTWN
jgi:hypothetical protein